MKLKLGKLIVSWADECELQTCDYYTHYLRYGPPTMSHQAFHVAMKECLSLQREYLNQLESDKPVSSILEQRVHKLEVEVRA